MLKSLSWECKWLTRLQTKMTFLGKGRKALRGREREKLLLGGGAGAGGGGAVLPDGRGWSGCLLSSLKVASCPVPGGRGPSSQASLSWWALISGRASGRCVGGTARHTVASLEHGTTVQTLLCTHVHIQWAMPSHGRPARQFLEAE